MTTFGKVMDKLQGDLPLGEDLPPPPEGSVKRTNPFTKPDYCYQAECPLLNEPGPVWGFGPADAPLAFIGEAPGAEEVDYPKYRGERFKPFVGGAGRLLRAVCYQAGVDLPKAFISNVVKCRPPGNRTPTPFERHCCTPFLQAELDAVKPNVTIALGDTALQALTGRVGISLWRGVPIEGLNGRKVFPTWHPAFIARMQHQWPFAVHDLSRAGVQGGFPELRRVPFEIIRDASVTRDGQELLSAALGRGAITFDFETTGLSPQRDSIIYLGLASSGSKAHVLPWTGETKAFFQNLLDNPGVEIVGQNILSFDLPFAEAKGLDLSRAWGKVFDTMVAFHLANASYGQTSIRGQEQGEQARGMEKDLSMIASCHTDMEYWKSREDYKRDLLGVCGKDCIATDRAALDPATGLKVELAALDMTDLYYKHVLPVHPILKEMSNLGVKVDEDRAARWSYSLEQQANQLEQVIREGLGDPLLNLESPPQLMSLLYDKMGLPEQRIKDAHGGWRRTVNVDALDALSRLRPENALLRGILDVRKLRKLKGTYVDPALRAGRLHPSFGVSKASTGRLNCWNPNAQNVPEDMRDFWIPDSNDHVLLSADWSQIEWRLSMVLSGDPVGLELLSKGVDNHRAIAAEALQKDYNAVTGEERQSAKVIVYGLGYGRGVESLATSPLSAVGGTDRRQIIMPRAFVETFVSNFFTRFARFKEWRDECVRFVEKNNYLANAFKRRRWWYTQAVTEVFNFPQQSTAADMMYEALIACAAGLPKGATLRLTVHDELVLNVPLDCVKETWAHVKAVMERTWEEIVSYSAYPENVRRYYPNGWSCPVDIHIGRNWKQTKSKDPVDVEARRELSRHLGLVSEETPTKTVAFRDHHGGTTEL